jgi:hypothetical protein
MLLPVIQTLQFHMGQRETGLVRVEGGTTGRSGGSFVSFKSTSAQVLTDAMHWIEGTTITVFRDVMSCLTTYTTRGLW